MRLAVASGCSNPGKCPAPPTTASRPSRTPSAMASPCACDRKRSFRSPDHERRRRHAMEPVDEAGRDVARLPDEAGRHHLIPDGRVLVHVRRVRRVVEEERHALVGHQHEVVRGRIATEIDARRAHDGERGEARASDGGLNRQPSAQRCADHGDRSIAGEGVGDVRNEERHIVDRLHPVRAFRVAEARQFRRDDREALAEDIEQRRPCGRQFVMQVEKARAVSGASSREVEAG